MRVVMACVLSFVLALVVGIFVLPGTGPTHKSKPKPKPAKLQSQAALSLEPLPALPAFPTSRIGVPSNQDKEAGPLLNVRRYEEAEKASLSAAYEVRAEQPVSAGVSKRGDTVLNMAPSTAQIVTIVQPAPKPPSVEPPRQVSQTKGAATGSASGASRPPATSAKVAPASATRPPATSAKVAPASAARPPATSAKVPPASATRPPATSAKVPPAGPSRSPTASTTVPPVVSPAQGPRKAVVTRPTPSSAPAQTPDVTQASPSESAASDAYVLGPGDQIEVNVPHLAVTVTIRQDGVISLPLISPVKAAGKTTAQLAGDLTNMYAKVLAAPSVTVFVRQPRLSL